MDSSAPPPTSTRRRTVALAALACLASLTLYARPLLAPVLFQDDFQMLEQSWTWPRTCAGLWRPHNEHFMPLGRLLTYALVRLGGSLTAMPYLCVAQGPVALLAGMVLVFLFVRTELGGSFYGLVAMTLFGVSCVYQQGVWWFAASFAVLALDTMLLGLLAAQRWRHTGRWRWLAASAGACFLAPGWFASGVLAGPLCALYLLPDRLRAGWRAWLAPLAPAAGTALALAVIVPLASRDIANLEHNAGQSPWKTFHPLTGLEYTARSVVDNLLPGIVGVGGLGLAAPVPLVAAALVPVAGVAAWWWRQTPRRRLLLLGAALVLLSYGLTYSARAEWDYAPFTTLAWTRYHLLPQLGLALFVAGGLPGRAGKWFVPAGEGLTARQALGLAVLVGVCWLVQLPRGIIGYFAFDPPQAQRLSRIEQVDGRCRRYHVSADTAREALGKLDLSDWYSDVNGWTFLRGSDDPRPHTPAEIRELLQK
jgi:hypothetical protein